MKFPNFLKIAALLLIAAGASPAYTAVWQWSKTASSNATADPTINWAEGMSPSSINDSARAMMARLSEYRDDLSGLVVTGGSSTAYTATTNQGLCPSSSTPNNGQMLTITVNSTNGVAPTLAVDACTAAPIQSSPAVGVPSASLIQGSPYTLKYDSGNAAWMLNGFFGSTLNVPLGGIVMYTGLSVPNSNYVFPAGQCLSNTTYNTYWQFLGSPASGPCAGGQFQIIDMIGRVAAGLDPLPGFSAKNRLTNSPSGCGSVIATIGASCANGNQSQTLITNNLPPYTPSGTVNTSIITTGGAVANVAGPIQYGGTGAGGNAFTISAVSSFSGNPMGGSSLPVPSVPPLVGVTYLLRVL
jgi:hypothetical protein